MDANRTFGRSIYVDPKAPHQELTDKQRGIMDAVPYVESNPIVQRLHGRIAQLLRHGRVKDPELMQSAGSGQCAYPSDLDSLKSVALCPRSSGQCAYPSDLDYRAAVPAGQGRSGQCAYPSDLD